MQNPKKGRAKNKLNGNSSITIKVNEKFTDPGATATDNKDGDLSSKIKVEGRVDTSKAGTYKITYTVEDAAKNVAKVTRTVIVKAETVVPEKPIIPEKPQEPDNNEEENAGGDNTGEENVGDNNTGSDNTGGDTTTNNEPTNNESETNQNTIVNNTIE